MSEYTLLRSKIEEADDADEVMEILRLEGDRLAQKSNLAPDLVSWLDTSGYSIVPTHNPGQPLVRSWSEVEQSVLNHPSSPNPEPLMVGDRVSYKTGIRGPMRASQIGQGRITKVVHWGSQPIYYIGDGLLERILNPSFDQVTKLA